MRYIFIALALAMVATPTHAAVIFDNIDLGASFASNRPAGSSPGARIDIGSANVVIGGIAVRNDLSQDGYLKFLIFRHRDHATPLFVSAPKFFVDDGMSLKVSAPLSFTLLAGESYDIGAISDVRAFWSLDLIPQSRNGITSINDNANFLNFTSPFATGHASADTHIQLFDTVLVTEPATLAILGLGLVGLGISRHRRVSEQVPLPYRQRLESLR